MECYKLAIAISGAVSLGSYESGVMYEIIKAIGDHNQALPENSGDRIEIDVITGASAGGLTAAILAQLLLYDKGRLAGPKTNAMYQAWVRDIDIERLLEYETADEVKYSLLSSRYILYLCEEHILARYYISDPPPAPQRHPASAGEIHLGLALSNMNGVDYGLETSGFLEMEEKGGAIKAGSFVYTGYQDRIRFKVCEGPSCDTREFWSRIGLAAMAGGAVPMAFRAQDIPRQCDDKAYDGAMVWEEARKTFTYLDGGIFDNYPLGMAKEIVNGLDDGSHETGRRFYLYISPNPRKTSRNDAYRSSSAQYYDTIHAVANAIWSQARFQEWVKTHKKNQLVGFFDSLSQAVRKQMEKDEQAARHMEGFNAVLRRALEEIAVGKQASNACPDSAGKQAPQWPPFPWEQNSARLKTEFSSEYGAFAKPMEAETWIQTISLLEYLTGAIDYDFMTVYTITAGKNELAGEELGHFGGFLDERFRDFDYQVGRRKAQRFLVELAKLQGNHLPLKPTSFEDVEIPDNSLAKATLSDTSRDKRESVADRIYRAFQMLVNSKMEKGIRRWILKYFVGPTVVRKMIKDLLCL
jgi:hypothetical protein